jgi:hypothetical protein
MYGKTRTRLVQTTYLTFFPKVMVLDYNYASLDRNLRALRWLEFRFRLPLDELGLNSRTHVPALRLYSVGVRLTCNSSIGRNSYQD